MHIFNFSWHFCLLVNTLSHPPTQSPPPPSPFITPTHVCTGEDRGVWFNRLAAYEKENELQIEDMVRVILDMKKKDEKRLAEEELKRKGNPPCSSHRILTLYP